MKKIMGWLDRFWYLAVLAGVIGAQALVFLIFREDSYLTVQDNLDLFVAHFQVLKHWDGWFAQNRWDLDYNKAFADYSNGVLMVTLPKSNTEQGKRQKININKQTAKAAAKKKRTKKNKATD